jgi:hypothetical protein
MTLMETLWIVSTLTCAAGVVGMIRIYYSMENSLTELAEMYRDMIREFVIKELRSDYEYRSPGMAKDTQVIK